MVPWLPSPPHAMAPTHRKTSPSWYVVRYADTDPMDPITYPRTAFDHSRALLPRTLPPRPQQFESHHSLGMLGQPTQERGHAFTWLKGIRTARSQSVDVNSSPAQSLTTRYVSNIRKESPIMESPVGTSNLHTPSKSSYQHLRLNLTHSDTSFPSLPVLNSECRVFDQTLSSPVKGSLLTRPSLVSASTLPLKQKSQRLVRVLQPISKNLSLGRKPRGESSVKQQLPIAVAQLTSFTEGQPDPSSPTTVTSIAPMPVARRSSETSHPPSHAPSQLEAGATNSGGEKTNLIHTITPLSVSPCKFPDRLLPLQSTSPSARRRPIPNPTEYGARRRTVSQIDLGGPRENPVRTQRQKRPTTAPATFPAPFQVNATPTQRQLSAAASFTVIAENGVRCPFGDLFLRSKTVVIFIRHFWCVCCSFYTLKCC